MRLAGEIQNVKALTDAQKERMFELMKLHFDGIDQAAFNSDLSEKQWVILLYSYLTGTIVGFSTQMIIAKTIDDIPVTAVFSGDTIIHKDYWGDTELVRLWGRLILSLMQKYEDTKMYWFLISMGYKTYRFLPVFFKEFYPRYDKPTPEFEQNVLDTFGQLKYPLQYNSTLGIIHHSKTSARLKSGIADIKDYLLKNPHIAFFLQRNPFYYKGDELACVAELTKENLKTVAYKIIHRQRGHHITKTKEKLYG